jgi:hypothetical protein
VRARSAEPEITDQESATAPPATSPSCGQQPQYRPGGRSKSSSSAPPKPNFAAPDSSAPTRQEIKSTIPPNLKFRASTRRRFDELLRATGADAPVCLDRRPRIMRGIGEILSAPLAIPSCRRCWSTRGSPCRRNQPLPDGRHPASMRPLPISMHPPRAVQPFASCQWVCDAGQDLWVVIGS